MKFALVLVTGLVVGMAAGMFLLAPATNSSIDPVTSPDPALAVARERVASLEVELARVRDLLEDQRPEVALLRPPMPANGDGSRPGMDEISEPAVPEPPAQIDIELTVAEVRRMLQSDDPREMVGGLRTIDRLGNREEAIAHAHRILGLANQPPWLPTTALRVLAGLGGPEAADAIVPYVSAEPPWLAAAAVRVLGELGEPGAIPALRAAFPAGDPRQQIDIAVALRLLGDSDAANQVARQAMVELAAAEAGHRAAAVRTIALLRDPAHNPVLVGLIADESPDVRQSAIGVLAQQGTAAELPALQSALSDAEPDVVASAERAIRFIELREESGEAVPRERDSPGGR